MTYICIYTQCFKVLNNSRQQILNNINYTKMIVDKLFSHNAIKGKMGLT